MPAEGHPFTTPDRHSTRTNHELMEPGTFRVTMSYFYKRNPREDARSSNGRHTFYNVPGEAIDELNEFLNKHFEKYPYTVE